MTSKAQASDLADLVRSGDRPALARAITLVESVRPDHRVEAEALVDEVLGDTGHATRIGVSGAPGVGKSTFIEALGLDVVERGHRVAVLAVDPSSTRSGGSILGDKTRMVELSRHPDAFIRPSPSGGSLGGVARRTRDALLLCEAAGFDVVIVETVGVGQSEIAVADMVDFFLVLVAPGAGDDLQGMKRGIMELADLVVVNKADGDLAAAASRLASDHRQAVQLLRPRWASWQAEVVSCSSVERQGIEEVWGAVERFRLAVTGSGELDRQRSRQAVAWMWSEIRDTLLDHLRADPQVAGELARVEPLVAAGMSSAAAAARAVLATFERSER